MSEFKGTPGPWKILPEEFDKPYIRIRGTQMGKRYKIANILSPVYDGMTEREAEETRANARIVVVAPEMLKTLQLVLQLQTRGFIVLGDHYTSIINDVVKKALGEV